MDLLTTTYKDKIEGTLGCFDRVIITGTISQIRYSEGMTSYLYSQNIRIFDYTKFAEHFKEELRANAEQIAKENKIQNTIFINCSNNPNPFREYTVFKLQLKHQANVILKIWDITGKLKSTFDVGLQNKGTNVLKFENPDLPPGIYFYTFITNNGSFTGKMVVR